MKKVILSLVFVLAAGVMFINATSSNDGVIPNTEEANKIIEDFGCASDCVQTAREGALWEVSDHDDRSFEGELTQAYMRYYNTCYELNCA